MEKLISILKLIIRFDFISKLIAKGIITSSMGRIIEGAMQTAILGILTYIGNCLETNDRTQWKATAIVLGMGFVKSIWSGITKAYRDNAKSLTLNQPL